MDDQPRIIDAAIRFARSNPEVLAYATQSAPATGRTVDQLLLDAIERMRSRRR